MPKTTKTPPPTSEGPPVLVTGYVHDLDRDVVEAEIELVRHHGEKSRVIVPRGDLASPMKLKQLLDPLGTNYRPADIDRLAAAHTIDTAKTRFVVSRFGWRPSHVFAWPGREIEEEGRKVTFLRAEGNEHLDALGRHRGTLKQWNDVVCPIVAGSDYAVTLCGVVFAGPLLRFSSAPEGALFALSGGSGAGKTDSCLAAQAVMGDTERFLMASWDATREGMKDMLAASSDVTVILDDTSRDGLAERDRLRFLQDVGHALAGGGKRARAKAYEAQHGRAIVRRPALGITSGEMSADDLASISGQSVQGGVRVRVIDIAVPPPDEGGVFNQVAKGVAPGKVVGRTRTAAKRLEAALKETYGVSFPHYLVYLEANRRKLSSRVRAVEEGFIAEVKASRKRLTSSDLRIAQKFGLVLAGLRLAIKAGAVSWSKSQVDRAVMTSFKSALRRQMLERTERVRQVKALRKVLRDPAKTPRLERAQAPTATATGFRRKLNGVEVAYMRGDQIGPVLAIDEQQVAELVGYLSAKKHLLPGTGGDRTRPTKVGGQQLRYYVFDRSFFASSAKKRHKAKAKKK